MLLDILILIVGLITLILGGDVLVKGASRVALRFDVSPMIVGLTIVAFSTSAPEMLVSLNAAFKEVPDFAMGNVVGSNIANLSLVLGTACLFGYIPIHKGTARRDWLVTMLASILLFFFTQDGDLVLWEGAILFSGLIIYLSYLLVITKKDQIKLDVTYDRTQDSRSDKAKDLLYITLGGVCLYFGSDWFISGAESLATDIGVSQRVIGLTVLALGTSLPELTTSIIAARKGETDLALGNLFGSNIFNILSILGITSMVHGLGVNTMIIDNDLLWMLGLTLGILPLMLFRRKLSTISGIILLSYYGLYIFMILR
ncbi:calcium/sodium antiporter [Roseivirga sp.]|uniref:calcium/sodium antiporter n=1 Tax=Roseivirga sp. TaxID=1964215 RepID=UPI003B8B58CA